MTLVTSLLRQPPRWKLVSAIRLESGELQSAGVGTGDRAVPTSELGRDELVPSVLDGVEVDVDESGFVTVQDRLDCGTTIETSPSGANKDAGGENVRRQEMAGSGFTYRHDWGNKRGSRKLLVNRGASTQGDRDSESRGGN